MKGKQKLGLLAIVGIVFFNVCGGPGSVEIMYSAGPLPGLIGLLIFPFFWSGPLALITCELSSAFPDNGGYGLWVSEAFGEFWGFQESFLSWFAGVIDSAVYPVLAFEILTGPFLQDGQELVWWLAYLCKLTLCVMWTLPNLIGVQIVGKGLVFLTVIVLCPFIVLSIICIFNADWNNLLVTIPNPTFGTDWFNLFNVLFWNFGGFDCISTVAGEVENPAKTLPRALLCAIVMVVLAYLVPLTSAAAAGNPPALTWGDDEWSTIAFNMGGPVMLGAVLVSTFFGNMGIFIANMFEDAWQLNGMAEQGLVPKIFAKRLPKYDTPIVSITAAFIIIACLCAFDFSFILPVDTFFTSCAATLEFLAYGKLRWSRPHMKRPFQVPGVRGKCSLICFLFFPLLVGFTILYTSFFIGLTGAIMNLCGLSIGVGLYYSLRYFGYINYNYVSKNKRADSLDPAAVIPYHSNEGSDDESSSLLSGSSEDVDDIQIEETMVHNQGTYDPGLVLQAQNDLKEKIQMTAVKS